LWIKLAARSRAERREEEAVKVRRRITMRLLDAHAENDGVAAWRVQCRSVRGSSAMTMQQSPAARGNSNDVRFEMPWSGC